MIAALSGTPPAGVRVLIATRPVDFRHGADGLVYDGTGLVLIWERLEGTKFTPAANRAPRTTPPTAPPTAASPRR